MRDVRVTVTPAETHAAVRALWRTEAFRRSHDDPDGWVRACIDRLARRPRLWCELDDPAVERSHFLAWMNVIPHRHEYANPAIADLYYLHEYLHAAQMTHAPDPDRDRWARKIWDNEREASLGSEVRVYFELPSLRAQTFDFPIWADRWLSDPARVAQHRDDPAGFQRWLVAERERAMVQPIPGDANEALIATYHQLNVAWAEIWSVRYREVESRLARFDEACAVDPSAAADELVAWLAAAQGEGVCPFEDEARRFAAVVNRAR